MNEKAGSKSPVFLFMTNGPAAADDQTKALYI